MSTWDIDMNGQTSNGTDQGYATTQASKERETGMLGKI